MKQYLVVLTKQMPDFYKEYLENFFPVDRNFIWHVANDQDTLCFYVENNHQKYDGVFVLDDYGIYPYMRLCKNGEFISAVVADEHSAYMTHLHNNAKILITPYCVLSREKIVNVIHYYLKSHFEAGRHMVRIDMLKKLSEGS